MDNATPMFTYNWYGLSVSTPFVCPELPCSSRPPEVSVRWAEIGEPDIAGDTGGICYRAEPGRYLLDAPGIARFLLEDGCRIAVERVPAADEDALRLFFYNGVAAALLAQRGLLVLKASVVARDGKAFVLTGTTSVGKSLAAAGLGGKGYVIVSDGVCVIGEDGRVLPGFPALMLWKKGLEVLSLSPESYKPVRAGMNKFYYPVQQSFSSEALPVAGIFLLSERNTMQTDSSAIEGVDKFISILSRCYFPELAQPMGLAGKVNQLVALTARRTNMRKILFNMESLPFGEYIEFLEKELER